MTEEQTVNATGLSSPVSPEQKSERQQRLLTKRTSAVVRSIADAVVIKNDNMFFVALPNGNVPLEDEHGFGLYYHDCRFLNGYELKLNDTHTIPLVSTAQNGFKAEFELTNPDIRMVDGRLIPRDDVGIQWERTLYSPTLALYDQITVANFGPQQIEFSISLTFNAGFEDVFAVRGFLPEKIGERHSPSWQNGVLSFLYDGADGLYRSLSIHLSPMSSSMDGTSARYQVTLLPQERKKIVISLVIAESSDRGQVGPSRHQLPNLKRVETVMRDSSEKWVAEHTGFHSDSELMNKVVARSMRDLGMLTGTLKDDKFFAAGIPWFATLFGRDSIITALQTLAFDPDIAEQTLRLLAKYQGQRVDDRRDEQPGKIMHELRVGELSRIGEIPYDPNYGTVDATLLFLILIGRHAAWTGTLSVFNDLRGNVELALEWMSKYGDFNSDGYIEYMSKSEKGLINQGWKDSGDAIVNADGSLAVPPIALVEVQGYAYLAKTTLASLYRRAGEPNRAAQLQQEAEELRRQFNRDFWLDTRGFYALALQKGKRPVEVVASNPGQALWTGIVDNDKAGRTMEVLMAEDMYSGWGIRTLSRKEKRFNPIGYHLGSVWPHDNSIIAAGLRQYGFDDAAKKVTAGIFEAAIDFGAYRLPELFSGFSRDVYGIPVRYPVACHPQAWAAGSVLYLLQTSLGLMPEAFDGRLRIVRPMLPDFIDNLDVHRMRVGDARVDLKFRRSEQGIVVDVLKIEGRLEVLVEDEGEKKRGA